MAFVAPELANTGADRWLITLVKYTKLDINWQVVIRPGKVDVRLLHELREHCIVFIPDSTIEAESVISQVVNWSEAVVTWGARDVTDLAAFGRPVILVSHTTKLVEQPPVGHTHLVAVSFLAANHFTKSCPDKVHIIQAGVDLSRLEIKQSRGSVRTQEWGLKRTDIAVGVLGRHSPEKNPIYVAKALRHAPANYKMINYGWDPRSDSGQNEDYIEAAQRMLGDRFIYRPWTDDVASVLRALDMYVQPSKRESFGIGLVEAWCVGVPTITTRTGIVEELHWDSFSNVLPLQLTEHDLVKAITATYSYPDPNKLERVKKLARQQLSGEVMGRRWVDFLKLVLSGKLPDVDVQAGTHTFVSERMVSCSVDAPTMQLPDTPVPTSNPHQVRALWLTPNLAWGGAVQWMKSISEHANSDRLHWCGMVVDPTGPVIESEFNFFSVRMPLYSTQEHADKWREELKQWFPPELHNRTVICKNTRVALAEAIKRLKPDVIVAWGVKKLPQMVSEFNLPVVLVSQDQGAWQYEVAMDSSAGATHLVAVSEAAAAPFRSWLSTTGNRKVPRIEIIPNCVELDRCTPADETSALREQFGIPQDKKVVTFIGRMEYQKYPEAAILAVEQLGDPYWAVYVGDGTMLTQLQRLAQEKVPDRHLFLEPVRRCGDILSVSDVLMMTTRHEGFSLLSLEAWAAGVPTIHTMVGAIPELVTEHRNITKLVDPVPDATTLKSAVEWCCEDTEEVRRMLQAARALVFEHYSARRIAKRWEDYLHGVCQKSTATS